MNTFYPMNMAFNSLKELEEARKKLVKIVNKEYKDQEERQQLIDEARKIIRKNKDRIARFVSEDRTTFQNLLEQEEIYDDQLFEALQKLELETPDVIDAIYKIVDSHRLLKSIVTRNEELTKKLKEENKDLT